MPTPAMAWTFPSLVRIRIGASPPQPDMRIFGGRGRENAGDAGIDGVAARVVHAHGGFGRIAAAGRDGAVRAPRRKLRRAFGGRLLRKNARRMGEAREPSKRERRIGFS